jgi:hypothetical protein
MTSRDASQVENNDPTGQIEEHILPRLDPDYVDYFVKVLSKLPQSHLTPIEEVRAHPETMRSPIAVDTRSYEGVADHDVTSEDGVKFPVRVYHPDPTRHGTGPYAVHLNYHGK